jgi:hypothetical protein
MIFSLSLNSLQIAEEQLKNSPTLHDSGHPRKPCVLFTHGQTCIKFGFGSSMAAARAYYYSWDSPHAKEALSLQSYCLPLQLETLNLENGCKCF